MGMFDYIEVKCKLPMPDQPFGYEGSDNFQTKCFENNLAWYLIDENGYLYQRQGKQHFEKKNTTQVIEIHDFQTPDHKDYDYWISYEVHILNGMVVAMKVLEFEAKCSKTRKQKDAEFDKAWRERSKFIKTFRYRVFYSKSNALVDKIFNCISKFGLFLNRASMQYRHYLKF